MNCKDSNLTPQETNSISNNTTPPSPRQRLSLSQTNQSSTSLTRRRIRATKDELSTSSSEIIVPSESVSEVPKESAIIQDSKPSQSSEKLPNTEIINSAAIQKTRSEEPLFKGAPPRTIQRVDKKKITQVFTEEEVAKHNTADNCWMIIKGGVYDITAYFPIHPGGTRALLKFAGKDGTENVQFHSSNMMKILDTYFYIGKLKGCEQRAGCVLM